MSEYRCSIEITDTVEASSKEEAQEIFLNMVEELGVKHYCLESNVSVVEEE